MYCRYYSNPGYHRLKPKRSNAPCTMAKRRVGPCFPSYGLYELHDLLIDPKSSRNCAIGSRGVSTTETARSLANKASEAPDRSARTQFPPQPTPHRRKEPQIVPKTTARTIRKETEKPEENIRDKALKINRMERVLNEDRFPNHLTSPEAIILVAQVHNRANYFKYLIESLKAIQDVDRVLVIISHDLYLEEMNSLVRSIDFCRASVSASLLPLEIFL